MYNISNDYKNYIDGIIRRTKVKIIVDNEVYDENYFDFNEIPKITIENDSIIGGFPIGTCSFTVYDSVPIFAGKEIEVYKGFDLGDKIEYIKQGYFTATAENIKYNESAGTIVFTGYDRATLFDVPITNDIIYPITYKDFLIEICSEVGILLETQDFPFADKMINQQPNFTLNGTTYREIISDLAEINGAIAYITRDGKLRISKASDSGIVATKIKYSTLSKEVETKPINTLVLGKEGVEDNIYYTDKANDEEEVIWNINDNVFCDLIREEIIKDVYKNIKGMSIIPFTIDDYIDDYFLDLNDIITIEDRSGNTFKSTILHIQNTGRIRSTFSSKTQETNEDIDLKGSMSTKVNNIKLVVDHVNNELTSIANAVSEMEKTVEEVVSPNNLYANFEGEDTILNNSGDFAIKLENIRGNTVEGISVGENGQIILCTEWGEQESIDYILNINNPLRSLIIDDIEYYDEIDIINGVFIKRIDINDNNELYLLNEELSIILDSDLLNTINSIKTHKTTTRIYTKDNIKPYLMGLYYLDCEFNYKYLIDGEYATIKYVTNIQSSITQKAEEISSRVEGVSTSLDETINNVTEIKQSQNDITYQFSNIINNVQQNTDNLDEIGVYIKFFNETRNGKTQPVIYLGKNSSDSDLALKLGSDEINFVSGYDIVGHGTDMTNEVVPARITRNALILDDTSNSNYIQFGTFGFFPTDDNHITFCRIRQ